MSLILIILLRAFNSQQALPPLSPVSIQIIYNTARLFNHAIKIFLQLKKNLTICVRLRQHLLKDM